MSLFDRDPGELSPKEIGYMQAFKAITAGLIVALLIMFFLAGTSWLTAWDFLPSIFLAIVAMYVSGYFFGGIAGYLIIKKRYASGLIGIACGFLILWSATFAGSLLGYFSEGRSGGYPDEYAAFDYIMKPLYWVTFFGLLPVIGVGLWYGLSIERKWRKIIKAKKDRETDPTRIASK